MSKSPTPAVEVECPSDIRAGDVVVCVDVRPSSTHPSSVAACARLKRGGFYRIESFGLLPDGAPSVRVGVPNADLLPQCSDLWQVSRFRKIDAPKTETSERILACRPVKETTNVD